MPLEELDLDAHIHGGLYLKVAGRMLPYLGYFGPSDVCFDTWCAELEAVYQNFLSSEEGEYWFDEGEQGQPAYVFKGDGNKGLVTIADGCGGGNGDPEWQNIEFVADDFLESYRQFRKDFVAPIKNAGAGAGSKMDS